MTHYALMVVFPKKPENIRDELEKVMKPYYECLKKEFVVEIKKDELESKFEEWKVKHSDYQKEYEYKNAKEWLEKWYGYEFSENINVYGYWRNPNAKYDWYEIGGRWQGMLLLKEPPFGAIKGKKGLMGRDSGLCGYDGAYVFQVDWEGIQKKIQIVAEYEISHFPYSEEYKKDLIKSSKYFHTYSVLCKNGKWYERTENVVSWAMKFKERFLDKLKPNDYVVIVDYHI
nr:MAG: hypothetical protein [Lokiarchaeota virus Ratatoskr Meg22_1012]